jgi:quercetin dioxygenase-like cupin family protein
MPNGEQRVNGQFDHPLPPPTPDMVMATPDVFDHLQVDSYQPIPGFPAMEMRDLPHVLKHTGGQVSAVVLRGVPGVKWVGSPWHLHQLDFQLAFILKGDADFNFEGVGVIRLQSGTVMYQPPVNRHRELGVSEDFELLLLNSPGSFKTTAFIYDEEAGAYQDLTFDTDDLEGTEALNKIEYADAPA